MRVGEVQKKSSRFSLLFIFLIFAVSACGKVPDFSEFQSQNGFSPTPGNGANAKIDILFVIDSSGTMSAVQSTLADSFGSFIDSFTDKNLQYHIGITSTDTCPMNSNLCALPGYPLNISHWDPRVASSGSGNAGGSRYPGVFNDGVGGLMSRYDTAGNLYLDENIPLGVTPLKFLKWNMDSDPLLAKQLTVERFKESAKIGTIGSGSEAPLSAVVAAIDRSNLSTAGNPIDSTYNNGFFRPGAFTVIIIVTDEDESFGWIGNESTNYTSSSDSNKYVRLDTDEETRRINKFLSALENLKGGQLDNFVLGVVAQPVGSPTCGGSGTANALTLQKAVDEINNEYTALGTGKAKARFYDLCAAGGFGSELDDLAFDVVEANARYALDQEPVLGSITVKVNGINVIENSTNGWQYESANNVIQFYGTAVPSADDDVSINYTPQ